MNVHCFDECILKRKPDVRPYNSASDNRIEASNFNIIYTMLVHMANCQIVVVEKGLLDLA
jgi:hypothetical protein